VQKSWDPHTVTFYPKGSSLPDLFTPTLAINPIPVTRKVFQKGESLNNSVVSSSGLLSLDSKTSKFTTWKVPFSAHGLYRYGCAVHGIMQNGSISVVADNVTIIKPKQVAATLAAWDKVTRKEAVIAHQEQLASVTPSKNNSDGTWTHYVLVGGLPRRQFMFFTFFPNKLKVTQNDTISFYGSTFHTVTFLNGAKAPELVKDKMFNPLIYVPTNPGGPITRTGVINSGLLVDPSAHYNLKVSDKIKGTIAYECTVHHSSKMFGWLNIAKPKKPVVKG